MLQTGRTRERMSARDKKWFKDESPARDDDDVPLFSSHEEQVSSKYTS
jgi:hypothetical protein